MTPQPNFPIVAGKPCGNGYPMAGLVTTPALAEAFSNGMEFFATFGECMGVSGASRTPRNPVPSHLLGGCCCRCSSCLQAATSAGCRQPRCSLPSFLPAPCWLAAWRAGGCTAAGACGLAVLDVIREERLQDNAATVGAHCLRRLRELQVRVGVGVWLSGEGGRAASLVCSLSFSLA